MRCVFNFHISWHLDHHFNAAWADVLVLARITNLQLEFYMWKTLEYKPPVHLCARKWTHDKRMNMLASLVIEYVSIDRWKENKSFTGEMAHASIKLSELYCNNTCDSFHPKLEKAF